ncbi:hypothetical protein L1987_13311 [Smallanthus sonchifolius]|uniref:Uncharacterized protein n=1 Tax=Smallanthus sonchifolius TaxID=185202 RepID=A0ACB9JGJ5_9ASTR|nr:hypothetical protein L1987_13311 [Smallanthus sonchifolius]
MRIFYLSSRIKFVQSFEVKSFIYLCGTKGLMVSSFNGAGLAVTIVMFVTTCLMTMVMTIVWKQRIVTAAAFLVLFGSVELLYLSAAFFKVPKGGWISLLLSLTFMSVMFVWNYGKLKKHQFYLENKVSMNRILSLGPSLGMVRVPGIGLVYTNLATGIPAIFGHFVTNSPAFHQVLVFVCVKSVQVPYVWAEERMLMGRVGPREYHMFRCIVRYGYKDVPHENYNFENRLVSALVEFLETEGKVKDEYGDTESENNDENVPERVFTLPDHEEKMVRSLKEIEELFSGCLETHPGLKEETVQILKARESGIAYILGHSYAKAKKSSTILTKFAIDVVYSFLSRNCRGTDVVLNVPHTSLLEIGMIYYAVVNHLEDAHEEIDRAISTALKESKPVYISVSCNLPSIPHPTFSREPIPFSLIHRTSNPAGLEAAVEAAAAFLDKAVKPVLVGGPKLRVAKATEAFVEFADASGYEFQMQYGSIGWSVGALLGYAQSIPDKRVIACIGDGSFQVTAQDVTTMIRCEQKSVIFLINNGGYTIEVEIHDGPYNVIKNWNYTGVVEAFNNDDGKLWTAKVKSEEELIEAISTATGEKEDHLCFIEVFVHKDDTSKELLEWGSRVCSANSRPPNPQ